MSVKKIMLVCSAGMSTSLLVSKMEKAAKEKNLEVEVFAVSSNEANSVIESRNPDIILLGPQVRFMKSQFENKIGTSGTAVSVINMQDYGMMNGEKVLDAALKLID